MPRKHYNLNWMKFVHIRIFLSFLSTKQTFCWLQSNVCHRKDFSTRHYAWAAEESFYRKAQSFPLMECPDYDILLMDRWAPT